MRHPLLPALLAVVALGSLAACDSEDERDVIEPGDSVVDGPGVPFDGGVSPGVDTPTNESENQGFERDEIPGGPVGNGLPAPP